MNDHPLHIAGISEPRRIAQDFRRLHALGRVGLREEACLDGRVRHIECRRCIEACPHGSLSFVGGALVLDPLSCSGCGQCAVACPGGALAVEGFALPRTIPAGRSVVCERSGPLGDEPAHTVPCLRGMGLNDWLRLALSANGAPLRLPDEDICRRCSNARDGLNPWTVSLDLVRRALAGAGAPTETLPKAGLLPSGNHAVATSSIPPTLAGRRQFFASLSRSVGSALTQAASGAPGSPVATRVPARRRGTGADSGGHVTRLLLLRLAQGYGHPRPQLAHLPALSTSAACEAQGACTRVCPSGALQLVHDEEGGRAELRFDAWLCVDCGACVASCPGRALSFSARAWRPFAEAPVVLASIEQRECARCGARCAAHADETLCDRCRKTADLARAGFALFSHRHRETPATPEGP